MHAKPCSIAPKYRNTWSGTAAFFFLFNTLYQNIKSVKISKSVLKPGALGSFKIIKTRPVTSCIQSFTFRWCLCRWAVKFQSVWVSNILFNPFAFEFFFSSVVVHPIGSQPHLIKTIVNCVFFLYGDLITLHALEGVVNLAVFYICLY